MFRSVFMFLSSLFRRDGIATVGKLFRYALSPKAWRWLRVNMRYRRIVKISGLVDEAWYQGSELDRWFERMEPCRNRGQVVLRCEFVLTQHLEGAGFVSDALVPESFQIERQGTPIKFPLATLRDYGDPLVKVKALKGDSLDDLAEVDSYLERENPELASILPRFPRDRSRSGMDVARTARENHVEVLRETVSFLRQSVSRGKPVDAVVLSLSGEEEWLRPLVDSLARSPAFALTVVAVPDMETSGKSACLARLRSARRKLADLPHGVLPVLFFDRHSAGPYPLEKEFARQNYAYFWKVFFADVKEFTAYNHYSHQKGENASMSDVRHFLSVLESESFTPS